MALFIPLVSVMNCDTEMKAATVFSDKEKFYEFPNGNIITVNNERFHFAEVLFQPSFIGKMANSFFHSMRGSIMQDFRTGLGDLIHDRDAEKHQHDYRPDLVDALCYDLVHFHHHLCGRQPVYVRGP